MKTTVALLLIASCLTGCTKTIYEATFPNGSLDCCIAIDTIHPSKQPLAKGESEIPDLPPANWAATTEGIKLGITDPVGNDLTPSAGIFSENVHFGIGSRFVLRATFQKPNGSHYPGHVWGAGSVVARTGDHRDLPDLKRLNLAVRVIGSGAILAVTEPGGKTAIKPIPQDMYESIFSIRYPQPYTLTLNVDRIRSTAKATLKTETFPPLTTGEFNLKHFIPATDDDEFTTVGATVAITDAPGQDASVEVLSFQIVCDPTSAGCP